MERFINLISLLLLLVPADIKYHLFLYQNLYFIGLSSANTALNRAILLIVLSIQIRPQAFCIATDWTQNVPLGTN